MKESRVVFFITHKFKNRFVCLKYKSIFYTIGKEIIHKMLLSSLFFYCI